MPIIIEKFSKSSTSEKDISFQFIQKEENHLCIIQPFDRQIELGEDFQLVNLYQPLFCIFDIVNKELIHIRLEKNLVYPLRKLVRFLLVLIHDYLLVHEVTFIISYPEEEKLLLTNNLLQRIRRLLKYHLITKNLRFEECKHQGMVYNYRSDYKQLEELLKQREETFSQMLFRLIDEAGRDEVEVYRKANIDRRLFSKIKSNQEYHPSKTTVIAFAISLNLNMDQTEDLLLKAGYSLINNNPFDIIIGYFIRKKFYDIDEINIVLVEFGEKAIGVIE